MSLVESCKDPDVVFSVPDITSAQVLQIIKGISPHKAAGIDKISEIGRASCRERV